MTANPRRRMVGFWEQKAGSAPADWEDGLAYDRCRGLFAVADGASTGNRSREWAFWLTRSFVSSGPSLDGDADRIRAATAAWIDEAAAAFDPDDPRFEPSRTPSWVQAAGREHGAYATLLAGRVGQGGLRAVSIGDCCLFVRRAAGGVESFPYRAGDRLGSSPQLLNSRAGFDAGRQRIDVHIGPFEPGDVLFVATDALADLLLAEPADGPVWSQLGSTGPNGFGHLVDDLRHRALLKNDDVTLLRAEEGVAA